jgi:hypothetical protein
MASAERHPRWRYWLMDEREAVNARRMDEKLRLREEALAPKARQREEKARRSRNSDALKLPPPH